jgi:Lipase (class 3)
MTTGYSKQEASNCIEAASIAYTGDSSQDYQRIYDQLAAAIQQSPNFGTQWQLVWLGVTPDFGNLLYVIQQNNSSDYIVAARGTALNFFGEKLEDIVEDLDVLFTSSWNSNPSIQISQGSWFGLMNILSMNNGINLNTNPHNYPGLIDFFTNIAQKSSPNIYVTGHSLGGTLATILTSQFIEIFSALTTLPPKTVSVKTYTFASPTVGNKAYATYFNNQTDNPQVWFEGYRIFIKQDIVPYWFGNLENTVNNGMPYSFKMSIEIITLTAAVNKLFTDKKINYTDVGDIKNGTAIELSNNNPANICSSEITNWSDYECWAGLEHDHKLYISLVNDYNIA